MKLEDNYKKKKSWEVFCKKDVLKNFTRFTGKHFCWSLFFNKVAGLRLESLFKKRLEHGCFPLNLVKFFNNSFLRTPLVAASIQKVYFCQIFVKKKMLNLFSTYWFN